MSLWVVFGIGVVVGMIIVTLFIRGVQHWYNIEGMYNKEER